MALAILVPCAAASAQSSINAYTPYTMLGVGELNTPGTLPVRSMGGAGLGMRSASVVNTMNPAAFSSAVPKSMIFDFGAEYTYFNVAQRKYAADGESRIARTAKNSVNFHEIAVQFPLAKGLGLGFTLNPFSSVGYDLSSVDSNPENWAEIGRISYNYSGTGDITEVKLGIGWEFVKNVSIGVAGIYYWGNIDRSYSTVVNNNITGTGSFSSTIGNDKFNVSRFKLQAGLQWNVIASKKHLLTLAATYTLGGKLLPRKTQYVYTNGAVQSVVVNRTVDSEEMRLPDVYAAGVFYQNQHLTLAFDYVYEGWNSRNAAYVERIAGGEMSYRNTSTFKLGVEYIPNRFDVRNYFKRISYRLGGRYGGHYQRINGANINQYAVTAGFGFPIKLLGASSIDVGVEFGGRGTLRTVSSPDGAKMGLVRQNYFKVGIGLSMFGEDYWFVRPKFD